MYQQFDSPTGVRFLALIREGRSFNESVRVTGIGKETGKETGYRWLRDEYLRFRGEGLDHAATQKQLVPTDHTAATTTKAIAAAFKTLPARLKRTLTWDQGVEMARHQELSAATGVRIYFAERSSPWRRGANENFNGLARQYFPKGTNLSVHSDDHVRRVCTEMNTRPRKSLGYLTPTAVFRAEWETCL